MQPCKNFGLGHSLPPSYDFKENTLRCYKLQGEHYQHQHGNICGWSQNAAFWGNSVHGLIEQVQLALTLWVPGELIPLLPCMLLSARPVNIAGLKQKKLPLKCWIICSASIWLLQTAQIATHLIKYPGQNPVLLSRSVV